VSSQTTLILVRHGETPANIDRVWHGSIDSPLTERGQLQAGRAAAWIAATYADAAAVYTSHLQRARLTAEAIGAALGLAPRLDEMLREYDLGSWEGTSYHDLFHQHQLWHHIKRDPHFAPHGGESPQQVTERIVAALTAIAGAHPRERVVIVTHGGALSMAMGALLDGSYSNWHRVMDNCAVSELVLEPAPALLRFNHNQHLCDL
jgi:broad specificity phosphatase PhoE